MNIQVIKDDFGKNTGIFIPMNDWKIITQRHQDLKKLITLPKPKRKISELAGLLSSETADALLKDVEKSRKEWDNRLNKII
jgi:hypothetical protein